MQTSWSHSCWIRVWRGRDRMQQALQGLPCPTHPHGAGPDTPKTGCHRSKPSQVKHMFWVVTVSGIEECNIQKLQCCGNDLQIPPCPTASRWSSSAVWLLTRRGPSLMSKALRESMKKLPPHSSRFCSRVNEPRISRLQVTLQHTHCDQIQTCLPENYVVWDKVNCRQKSFVLDWIWISKRHLSWYMKSISSISGHTSDTNLIWGVRFLLYQTKAKTWEVEWKK